MSESKEDRMTGLSRDLKEHIVSLLPMRDAIATSCLSPIWRYTWVSLTSLDFGVNFFESASTHSHTLLNDLPKSHCLNYTFLLRDDDDDDDGRYRAWVAPNVGYMVLLDQLYEMYIKNRQPHQVLKKLSFYVPMVSRDSNVLAYVLDVVSRWFSLAKDEVEELSYHVDACGFDRVKTLQNCTAILQCKRLTKLKLYGCTLTNVGLGQVEVPCLKQLTMAVMTVGQNMMNFLLEKCQALEELQLSAIKGVKVLRLLELSKLKKVRVMHIDDLDQVEINARTLQCLTLIKLKTNMCKVKVASNSNFRQNLVELFINGCAVCDDFFNYVMVFPHLKDISLIDCPLLKCIRIRSNCLARLSIEECPNLRQIELDTPKLLFLRYSNNTKNSNIISILSKCVPACASLFLKPPGVAFNGISWYSKLLALLTNFKSSKCVRIATTSRKKMIIPQELRESFCPPFCEVQDLSLTLPTYLSTHAILQHLDNLLWLSLYPRKISLRSKDLKSSLSLELQYEDGMKEWESCGCYSAQQINCVRHVFKDFRIVHHEGLGDAVSIRKLLDNALKKWKAIG